MPPTIDITGQRFGRLLVLGRGPVQHSESGLSVYKTWHVLCDCGVDEVLRDHRIPYCASNAARRDVATACEACRSKRICAACGQSFVSAEYRACCSDACRLLHRRRIDMDHYFRLVGADPELNKRRADKLRALAAVDPEVAGRLKAHQQAQSKKRSARLAVDPEYREALNAAYRDRYAAVADAVQTARRNRRRIDPHYAESVRAAGRRRYTANAPEIAERRRLKLAAMLGAMTHAQREDWLDRRRARNNAHYAAQMADPVRAAHMRAQDAEWRRRSALGQLAGLAEDLMKRQQELDDDDNHHD